MHHDVTEYRNFYYQTRIGRSVQRRVQDVMKTIWQDERGEVLIGYGFASPFLRPFRHSFRNIANLMPHEQGAMAWPPGERNVTVLCPEDHWPIATGSADHIIVAHALETSVHLPNLLAEVWRVLAPEGKVVFIVPNRLGVWASSDNTPLGLGRPFSFPQIERILTQNRFEVGQMKGALFAPPFSSRLAMKSLGFMEWVLSGRTRQYFAGALLVEATKHIGVMPPRVRHSDPIVDTSGLKPVVQCEI